MSEMSNVVKGWLRYWYWTFSKPSCDFHWHHTSHWQRREGNSGKIALMYHKNHDLSSALEALVNYDVLYKSTLTSTLNVGREFH